MRVFGVKYQKHMAFLAALYKNKFSGGEKANGYCLKYGKIIGLIDRSDAFKEPSRMSQKMHLLGTNFSLEIGKNRNENKEVVIFYFLRVK